MPIHIIDDDPLMRNLLLEMASFHSDHCITFTSAEEYLTQAGSDSFKEARLIITDVMMPGINGLELVRELRSLGLRSKIIVISGNFPDHDEAPHPSVCGLVQKPFDLRRMQMIIAVVLACRCRHTADETHEAIAYWPGIRIKCPHRQSD